MASMPARPDMSARSSSPSDTVMILGNSSARPPAARRNASCSARVARRVGSSKVMSGSSIPERGAPPALGQITGENGCRETIEKGLAGRNREDVGARSWSLIR